MAFFALNGVEVPIEHEQWDASPEQVGNPHDRMVGGGLEARDVRSRGRWSGTTPLLQNTEVRRLVAFLRGDYDLFTYEPTDMHSSRGKAVTTTGSRYTASSKFGDAGILLLSSGAQTATLASEVQKAGEYGLITYKNDNSGEYTTWNFNVGYRASTGDTYENGSVDATEDATNWHSLSGTNIVLEAKNDAGTAANSAYDHTVILWFDPSPTMMATWSAANYEWPTRAPYYQMTGDGAFWRGKSTHTVRCVVREVKNHQFKEDGVWHHAGAKIKFDVYEIS